MRTVSTLISFRFYLYIYNKIMISMQKMTLNAKFAMIARNCKVPNMTVTWSTMT